MRICPKCGEKFKYKITANILGRAFYKLKCDKCNTRIELTKKTDKINSIFTIVPLIFIALFNSYIINFITRFTKDDSISSWLLICIYTVWGTTIYNGKFPWTEFKEIKEN